MESTSREWRARRKQGRSRTGKSVRQSEDVMRTELRSREECEPCVKKKPLLFISRPYRKPTQVDEERILRPTGEALLRNSAK